MQRPLARLFIDERGREHDGEPYPGGTDFAIYNNRPYKQDHLPVTKQKSAAGHAVRATSAGRTPISSTKSSTGHLLGAAGAVETIFTALALYHGILPATLNFGRADDPDNPDARYGCDPSMDYVPNEARPRTVRAALCNAFGFGGANACVAMARWNG